MVFESEKIQIDNVIDTYGNLVEVETVTLETELDEWGEPVEVSTITREFKAVSDGNFKSRFIYGSQGKFDSSDLILIAKGEEVFDTKNDVIIFKTKRYKIKDLEIYEPADVRLAQQLVLGSE